MWNQLSQYISEVMVWIDSVDGAGLKYGVNDGTLLFCFWMSEEHPVLGSDFRGPELALQQICIQPGMSVVEPF